MFLHALVKNNQAQQSVKFMILSMSHTHVRDLSRSVILQSEYTHLTDLIITQLIKKSKETSFS